jgi:beta-N-acetylhexosaminidase
MRRLYWILPVCGLFVLLTAFYTGNNGNGNGQGGGHTDLPTTREDPPFMDGKFQWADSLFNSLTAEERIAQLFMVAAYSNRDQEHVDEIVDLVSNYNIGGLIFFQGGPVRQAKLTNKYQDLAKVPLMVSIDGEWGLAMRLDSTVKFPKQMTLGAIQDDSLVYEMGGEIAAHCKRMGIHVNLAPVVDVNNNRNNPVIGYRSFGQDKENVARKGIAYMKGLQDNGVLANAKHFPGHGDTDSDSHKTLPIIPHSKERIDSLELYPFKELIKNGLGSMMVAHLYIPSLDSSKNTASTLSKPIVTGMLKEGLGFQGLIFTDALNMRGVSAFYKPGEVDAKALIAGNDVLLFAEDVPTAINSIKESIRLGHITQEEVDERCRRILHAKQWAGLDKTKKVKLDNLYEDLNTVSSEVINRRLIENALTVVSNKNDILPLKGLDTLRIATISIGAPDSNTFQTSLERYSPMAHFSIKKNASKAEASKLIAAVKDYNLLIVGVHGPSNSPYRNFGVSKATIQLVNDLAKNQKIVLDVFASPYSLGKFAGIEKMEAVVVSYEDNHFARDLSGQLIFGGIGAKGKLPVTAASQFHVGHGIETEAVRFKYTIPEDLGMTQADLRMVDMYAQQGINERAYPGCQILAAKDGKVFYYKSFGHHTYDKKQAVINSDIYDLASVTKIAASTASLMRLTDEGKVSLDYSLCDYAPDLVDSTTYYNVRLRDMLAHQAGFVAWIPFYLKTLNKGQPNYKIYSAVQSDVYDKRVAEEMYIRSSYRDSIFQTIVNTPANGPKKYKYSDLAFYWANEIIQRTSGVAEDKYVDSVFYSQLGLKTMGYNPLNRFDIDRITPSEDDKIYRKQLIRGDVHDQGAAMLGGVCGHAGLFSDANDLGVMMQMMMDYGKYGGERYIEEKTLKEYTSSPFLRNGNRRGVGFDKPVRPGGSGPTCSGCASNDSFGHTGFTGITTWADPRDGFVYVFLSNRCYPVAENRKILTLSTRTNIQKVFYDAIHKADRKAK